MMPRTRQTKVVDGVTHWQCSKCKGFFPRDKFHLMSRSKSKVRSRCKECQRPYKGFIVPYEGPLVDDRGAIEEWRPWRDGRYEVSSFGRIKNTKAGMGATIGRIRSQNISQCGYPQCSLTVDGKEINFTIHRVVAEAYLGPCPEGMAVNHKDGIKTNNHPTNLEYVTPLENVLHAMENGLKPVGSACNWSVLTERDVVAIRRRYAGGEKQTMLAAEYGVSQSSIHLIVKRKKWKHVK